MPKISQFCTLLVGDERYGIPVDRVQEIIRNLDITPVALAPRVVKGLANLRGQIVMAIDLKERLMIADHSPTDSSMNVVVRTTNDLVSLLVDDVAEVIEANDEDFQPVPSTLRGDARQYLKSVYKLPNSLLLLLDLDRVLDIHKRESNGSLVAGLPNTGETRGERTHV